jgi:thioredoxin 1
MTTEPDRLEKLPAGRARRLISVAILALAVAAVLYFKGTRTGSPDASHPLPSAQVEVAAPGEAAHAESPAAEALPRLLDLGADKCVPCKMMAPILAELRREYAGRFEVVFIDVWKNRSVAQKYGIQVIPTQIFFDATGKELFRHQGFYSKEDILKTWQEHGFDFGQTVANEGSS